MAQLCDVHGCRGPVIRVRVHARMALQQTCELRGLGFSEAFRRTLWEQLIESFLIVAHSPPSTAACRALSGSSNARTFASPRLARVFTVPIGLPVAAAISE